MSTNSSTSYSFDPARSCCGNITGCYAIGHLINGTRLSLLFPCSIFILYLGYKQWRQQCSFRTASHFDILTYHVVLLELFWTLGAGVFYWGVCFDHLGSQTVGYLLMYPVFLGETLFHVLTCIDRYLAVVHPVTYRRLRGTNGVIIRNVSILCVLLIAFLWSFFAKIYSQTLPIVPFFCLMLSSFVVVSFCSFSVLCALFRPRPGTKSGDKKQLDHTKQRAFFTVMAITGVLCFWILGSFFANIISEFNLLDNIVGCMVRRSAVCFTMPNSFVLPLLYLHKVGKLPCCCYKRG